MLHERRGFREGIQQKKLLDALGEKRAGRDQASLLIPAQPMTVVRPSIPGFQLYSGGNREWSVIIGCAGINRG